MAAQAAYIADTIAGMKRVISKYQDYTASDSDEPYLQITNRGNKLKRKAHFLDDGQSHRTHGPKIYKRAIEHGGYQRKILRRNPKRYDEDGDELDDSESDAEADARVAEENPYAEIYLENLLLPLVSAATLPEHPSMSVAYTSPILTNMAQNACEMAQRERKTLANAKRLMTKLRGDETWLPCGLFYSERDEAMFNTEKLYNGAPIHSLPRTVNGFNTQTLLDGQTRAESRSVSRKSSVSGTELGSCNAETKELHKGSTTEYKFGTEKTHGEAPLERSLDEGSREVIATETQEEGDVDMGDARSETPPKDPETAEKAIQDEIVNIVGAEISITGEPQPDDTMQQDTGASYIEFEKPNGVTSRSSAQENTNIENNHGTVSATENTSSHHLPTPGPEEPGNEESEGNEDHGTSQIAPRRMRTRAQAQAASEPTVSTRNDSPESWVPPEIHPLFKIPETAIPDKDIGLPKVEADETRRLFTMYVQKQEEVCRGAERLYDGLLQADRQRKMVLKWCKAEGHVGEMSDGEDWYDKEEWGLEEDLEKGHNDEDGDTNAIIQGKKTRGRRA